MSYQVNFGRIGVAASARKQAGTDVFRLAVLGDFSARANKGELATGDELAARKPIKIDVDDLDDVMERLGIELLLPIGADGGTVAVKVSCMDDLHPDDLHDNLEIFSELAGLRQRLNSGSTFEKAAQEVQSWAGEVKAPRPPKAKPRGASVPTDQKLSDFARLTGRATAVDRTETPINELLKQIVGPCIVPEKDPRQDVMIAAVDEALAVLMRSVLHHPDFQTVEALWRSIDLLTRRLETSAQLKIVLYDVSAEEFAADLSAAESLEETGLYKLLVEQPALDAHQGALSTIIGCYGFEQTPPHAELLGRMAQIAASVQAPFITSIGPDVIKQDPDDLHPLVKDAWGALRVLPEAAYLGLCVPRFMLRMPYGKKTEPIDPFDFEEFTAKQGLRSMLWGNPAIIAGLLLTETFTQQGLKKMKLGSVMSVGDMPYHFYTDADGDQIALPCTERLLTARLAQHVTGQRVMPLLSIQGRPEARLGSFISLGGELLAGPWAPAEAAPAEEPEPEETPDEADIDEATEEASDEADDAATDEDAAGDDDDLSALLGELGDDESDDSDDDDDDEMDAELAALLADL